MTYRFYASQYGTTASKARNICPRNPNTDRLPAVVPLSFLFPVSRWPSQRPRDQRPSTANYDEDLGMVILSDWDHKTAFQSWRINADYNFNPQIENILIIYKNMWDCSHSAADDPVPAQGSASNSSLSRAKSTSSISSTPLSTAGSSSPWIMTPLRSSLLTPS